MGGDGGKRRGTGTGSRGEGRGSRAQGKCEKGLTSPASPAAGSSIHSFPSILSPPTAPLLRACHHLFRLLCRGESERESESKSSPRPPPGLPDDGRSRSHGPTTHSPSRPVSLGTFSSSSSSSSVTDSAGHQLRVGKMAPRRGLSPGTPVLEDIDIWNDNDNNEEGTGECENDAGSDADSLFVPTGPLIVSSGPSLARTPARTSLRSTRSSARRSSPSTRSTARSSSTLVPPRTSGRAPARAAARAANNTPAFPAVSLPRKEKRSYQAQTWKERNPANRSPTECPICHITLARRNHVQRHMNTAHSDDSVNVKPFKCICCPRVFTRLYVDRQPPPLPSACSQAIVESI